LTIRIACRSQVAVSIVLSLVSRQHRRGEEVVIRWFLVSLLAILGLALCCAPVAANEIPLELSADSVFISTDETLVEADGSVTAQLENLVLSSDMLRLEQQPPGQWQFVASGSVTLSVEGELDLSGDRLAAVIDVSDSGVSVGSFDTSRFGGSSTFENSADEPHTIYFQGDTGEVRFGERNEVARIEVSDAEVSTCNCCGVPLRSQPYTLHAERLLLFPDELIVAFGLTVRIAGIPTFWLPVYVQPLEDTLESPLFPSFGRSALRGWYLKWNVPFYVSEALFGSVLFDYYAKHDELAGGGVVRYAFAGHKGRVRVYSFPAKVGDPILEFSARHELPPAGIWTGSGSLEYRQSGGATSLDYGAHIKGASNRWHVDISATKEVEERNTDDEAEENDTSKTTERFPEITMSRSPWTVGSLSIQPRFEIGLYREHVEDDPPVEASRVSAQLSLGAAPLAVGAVRISPQLKLHAAAYLGDQVQQTLSSANAEVDFEWGDLSMAYTLLLVQGDSPFDFDAEAGAHRIGLSFSRSGWARLRLSTGFDLTDLAPDSLQAELSWMLGANWSLQAEYQLETAALQSLHLSGSGSFEQLQLSLLVPYLPSETRFDTIELTADILGDTLSLGTRIQLQEWKLTATTDVDATLATGPVAVDANARFQNLSLDRLEATCTYASTAGWGAKVDWRYLRGTIALDPFTYGVFWDIGDCLRIGIDRDANDTWFYLSILAFPEAVLRYAPESARIQAGNEHP